MPFDYPTNITAIYNALVGYNTTTAVVDLSANLTTRVKNIYLNDPAVVGLRGDIYPAVFVRVNSKKEDFAGMGPTGPAGARKTAEVKYDVIGFYRKDGAYGTQAAVLTELERLARNIEGVFQQETSLSGTALWCQVTDTNFYGPFQNNEMWIKAVVCDLDARYHFR